MMKCQLVVLVIVLALVQLSSAYWGRGGGWGYRGYGGWNRGWGGGYGGGWGGYRSWGYRGGWGGYRGGYWKRDSEQVANHVQCRFLNGTDVFSCASMTGVVDCQAEENFAGISNHYRMGYFAFGLDSAVGNVTHENYRYHLYPRKLDNAAWCNHTQVIDNVTYHLALYHSNTYKCSGFRIVDTSCWNRLVSLFNEVVTPKQIYVKHKGTTQVQHANAIGEVLVVGDGQF